MPMYKFEVMEHVTREMVYFVEADNLEDAKYKAEEGDTVRERPVDKSWECCYDVSRREILKHIKHEEEE